MGKLGCPCGEVLSDTACPNPWIGNIVTDDDMEELHAMLEKGEDNPDKMRGLFRDFWECRECGRIGVSWPERCSATVKWYVPEDGKPGYLSRPEDEVVELATRPDPTGLHSP